MFPSEGLFIRQSTVPNPVVTIIEGKNMKLTDSRMALRVQITASPGANIRYTLNGTSPKCRRNPIGTSYTGPIQLCGSPAPIQLQVIGCLPDGRSGELSSDVVSEIFNIRAFQPPAPIAPIINFDTRSVCSNEDGTWTCAVQPGNDSIRIDLTTEDKGCNSADFAIQADCIAAGYTWTNMPRCSMNNAVRPCQDVSYPSRTPSARQRIIAEPSCINRSSHA